MNSIPLATARRGRRLLPCAARRCLALTPMLFATLWACAQNAAASAKWIIALGAGEHSPVVVSLRKTILLKRLPSNSYKVHVSADNRFVLYANGQRVGDGPARGDRTHWRYETFDLKPFLHPGDNVIAARVWNFGDFSPVAQVSVRTGFLLWGDTPAESAANTDESWLARPEAGWKVNPKGFLANEEGFYGVGPGEILDAKSLDAAWNGAEIRGKWSPAVALSSPVFVGRAGVNDYTWRLIADTLPPMEYSLTPAGKVIRSSGTEVSGFPAKPVDIPAHTRATLLLDRETLTTAYPELTVGGGDGAKISLTYAEALIDDKGQKGNRNDLLGKHMNPQLLHDEFLPDGAARRSFAPLWWRTWRFLQLDVETKDQPVSLLALDAHFTAYPFQEKATFHSSDPELAKIWEVGWRTLRVNAHETHMDCPYWEQLQYAGDTRIQVLLDYTVGGDDRLARQSLRALASSLLPDGLLQSRYPNRDFQVIPPFSLLWIGMLHDYWMYRNDPALPKELLPQTRSVLAWFLAHQRPDGMLGKLPEDGYIFWHFVDWSFAFHGSPPEDKDGGSVPETLQFLAALRDAADLEDAVGDPARAEAYRDSAARIPPAVYKSSWDERRQLLADTPAKQNFSQHANILGVLLDAVPKDKQKQVLETILADELAGKGAYPASQNLTPASYYFRFYLARAIDHAGLGDDYLRLLGPWKEMLAHGLSTYAETPDPTRSEAHAWSAHPDYDLLTIVAGIRPNAPGFRRVLIAPHLGGLQSLDAAMPWGDSAISVSYRRGQDGVHAKFDLPAGLQGSLEWQGKELPLHSGSQEMILQ